MTEQEDQSSEGLLALRPIFGEFVNVQEAETIGQNEQRRVVISETRLDLMAVYPRLR
jgi:hypothetical protein